MSSRQPIGRMLRLIDRLLDAHLQRTPFTGRALANLAVAMATEYSGAARSLLLLDDGAGLAPVFGLEGDLQAPGRDAGSADEELVGRVVRTRTVAGRRGRVAAPILAESRLRGVLYFEARPGEVLPGGEDFAAAVAVKIAAILHNAELAERVSRQHENLEMLETVGARLSAGALGSGDFEAVLEAALQGTESDRGLLALPAGSGELPELLARGVDPRRVSEMASRIRSGLVGTGWRESLHEVLGEPMLCETLRGDPLTGQPAGEGASPIGFIAVGRAGGATHGDAHRTVFRALTSILAGALARRDHFRKATEDALTGTGSRLALELTFAHLLASAQRSGAPFSLLLLDIDRFKEINDAHGHLTGDLVLQEIGDLLRSRLRSQDFVGRYGGDEFVLLLPETDTLGAIRIARQLQQQAARQRFTARRLATSVSVGIAAFPEHGASFGELLQHADRALYASKTGGRDRISIADTPG